MCGIALAIGYVDERIEGAVGLMSDAQAHRGPDDQGLVRSANAVLAHRRLSIIDLSANGHQPMKDPESGLVIVYNGEVYNHRELREELAQGGVRFRSQTDTEVVLKAYARWGEACVDRLRGMFAFAVWDSREQRLFLARDRLGIKPLYFCQVDRGPKRRTLLVASEVRALLNSGLVERRIDPAALGTFVWSGFVRGSRSIVQGVRELPRGTTATVDAETLRIEPRTYWRLPLGAECRNGVSDLCQELESAVKQRLISDVPLGVFLSGGIDSSAVAALAVRGADTQIRTFSVGFDEAGYDETEHAEVVARSLGTDHTRILLTMSQFRAQLEEGLGSIDQPTFDQLNTYVVSRAVREAGITAALAGVGGDELFGGYTTFRDLPRAARWARRLSPLPQAATGWLSKTFVRWKMGRSGEVGPQVRWGKLPDVLATHGALLEAYQVHYALFTRSFYDQLLAAPAGGGVDHGLSPDHRQRLGDLVRGEKLLHAVSLLELEGFVGDRLLRDCDAASMAVSLELRVPLLDHRVVEAAASVAEAKRFRPLGSKRLLKELALQDLDPSIFERPKAGFVLPIAVWLERDLRSDVSTTLLDAELCRRVGLCPEAVSRLWRAFDEKAPGIYWSRVWSLYVLLWWCRKHEVWVH